MARILRVSQVWRLVRRVASPPARLVHLTTVWVTSSQHSRPSALYTTRLLAAPPVLANQGQ